MVNDLSGCVLSIDPSAAVYGESAMTAAAAMNETGASAGRPGDPCVMVIFGGSGDLTKRKLIPALYNLARDHFLAQEFAVVGIARRGMTHETFREKLTQDLKQ